MIPKSVNSFGGFSMFAFIAASSGGVDLSRPMTAFNQARRVPRDERLPWTYRSLPRVLLRYSCDSASESRTLLSISNNSARMA